MERVTMNTGVKLVLNSVLMMEDGYMSEDHKQLVWKFMNQEDYTVNEFFAVLDFLKNTPVPGPSYREDEKAKSGFVLVKLESIVQTVAMDNNMDFVDCMRLYSDGAAERVAYLDDCFRNNPATVPDREFLLDNFKKLSSKFKAEIMTAISTILPRGGLGSLSGLLAGGTPGHDQGGEDILDSWGTSDKKKLQ